MQIEHVAFNVAFPVEMTAWYVKHLKMRIVRGMSDAPFTHFLEDEGGHTIIEIYNNPADEVPAYRTMNPLLLHLAFRSDDPTFDQNRLMNAGADFVEELHLADGSHLIMLRDPWGLAIQLCKRGTPLVNRETNASQT